MPEFPERVRRGLPDIPVLCIGLGVVFLVQVNGRHVQSSPRGRLPGASSPPQGSRLFELHHGAFSPVPERLVKLR